MSEKPDAVKLREEPTTSAIEDESTVDPFDREALERDILSIARKDHVLYALQVHATTTASDRYAFRPSAIISGARDLSQLKEELERGLRAIFSASCDKRLETFHWMVMRLDREHSSSEIVDCIFDEAESQMNEADGAEKEIIAKVFGVTASI